MCPAGEYSRQIHFNTLLLITADHDPSVQYSEIIVLFEVQLLRHVFVLFCVQRFYVQRGNAFVFNECAVVYSKWILLQVWGMQGGAMTSHTMH